MYFLILQLNRSASSIADGSKPTGSNEGAIASSATMSKPFSAGATPSTSTSPSAASMVNPPSDGVPSDSGLPAVPKFEAVKRAQELAAKMGFRQDPQFAPLINLFPGQVEADMAIPQKPTKAPVLRLDALGREIDEHGNVVNFTKPSNLSTLKVMPVLRSYYCCLYYYQSFVSLSLLLLLPLVSKTCVNFSGEYQQTKEGSISNSQTRIRCRSGIKSSFRSEDGDQ